MDVLSLGADGAAQVLAAFDRAQPGLLTGMLTAVFVAFKPEWLATWSDRLYLSRPPQH